MPENDNLEKTASEETTEEVETEEGEQTEDSAFEMPEKFRNKSAEEIAKSHVELERELTKRAQKQAEFQKTAEQLMPLVSGDYNDFKTKAEEGGKTQDEIAEAWLGEVIGRQLDKRLAPIKKMDMQSRVNDFASRHDDVGEYLPGIVSRVNELAKNNPNLVQSMVEDNPEFLDSIYYEVKGRTSDSRLTEAKTKGKEEAVKSVEGKRAARTESANYTSNKSGSSITAEDVATMSPDEYEKNRALILEMYSRGELT